MLYKVAKSFINNANLMKLMDHMIVEDDYLINIHSGYSIIKCPLIPTSFSVDMINFTENPNVSFQIKEDNYSHIIYQTIYQHSFLTLKNVNMV